MGSPVVSWQIVTKQPEKLAGFYAELFGWTIDADNPLAYRRALTGADRGVDGGFWPAPPEAPSFVQLHMEVDDIAGAVGRATDLGATVVVPPQALPDGGRMAVLHDPEGIPFALVEPA